jgi:formate C-acetyltransferase
MRHSQNWTPDFSKILTRGVKGIREEAQGRLSTLSEPEQASKKAFLEAVIITCNAMTIWSNRYAKLAAELAAKETNPQRKKELQETAAVCE